jgi:site-specific DNA-methyltransferase (adenine-specific)
MSSIYYSDDSVTLHHADMREVLPAVGPVDAIITDPPYGVTSLAWDRWPEDWPGLAAQVTNSMWCFGSLRMFLEHVAEFDDWKLSQDIVWEKPAGSGWATDRFMRVHEQAVQFYRGDWSGLRHETPRLPRAGSSKNWRASGAPQAGRSAHRGEIGPRNGYHDDGTRLARSVVPCPQVRYGHHRTQKPLSLLELLIRYSVPEGGLMCDPFAGSGSTLLAARLLGRLAVGIEADEQHCEAAARRLAEPDLFKGVAA